MTRVLNPEIPGEDRRVILADAADQGWESQFAGSVAKPIPLVVEIGFGRGEFLIHLASEFPETAFVGVEYSHKRTHKMARRVAVADLPNVRLVEARGEEVVAETLPDGSVADFWVNFPDPWPKKRHARRRLIQLDFAALLAQKLVAGGRLKIATDDPGYAEWISAILPKVETLENSYAPAAYRDSEEGRLPTAYELEWRAQGRAFHFFEYLRKA